MRNSLKLLFLSLFLLMISCQKEQTLQKYYVDSQREESFMHMDISTNMIFDNLGEISAEKREKLKSFKKINVLTLPIDGGNQKFYQEEKEKVLSILERSEYKKLLGLKYSGAKLLLYYTGEPEAIKEVVLMTYAKEKGFTLVRLIGKDLNANLIAEILTLAKEEDLKLNLEIFEDFAEELE